MFRTVMHPVWKKGVCHVTAAFEITFQHETALFLKTKNQLMNFAMLPKYYISKSLPIYNITAIFAQKRRYASFLHRVFGNPSCYFICD